MPLTMDELKDIRDECMADDIDIPDEAVSWVKSEAVKYFDSGGTWLPRESGLEGAEVHAWYDVNQRQFESTDTDTMMDALSMALFKVTGDEEFKKDAPQQEVPKPSESKEHEPELKYHVNQLAEGVFDDSCA
uniref:Uncharacterized protein n=1 Tax=Prymnesium polylepis TaxID=72548 RepID=A0A6V3YT27_9EUKA|mmetsp:Transcript_67828/g.186020  ORF Transcript_67828/g.186020 Transcript_67828/m.186020 type:complete len:132 (+) Transcript_67828:133-528(+)